MESDYFFKAGAIEHYRIEIDGEALSSLELAEEQSEKAQLKKQIIFNEDYPQSIQDNQFILDLEGMGFVKQILTATQLTEIQSIFTFKEVQSIEPSYCGAVFRDVLVFYLDQQITGIVKLCFSCGHHVILGTSLNTTNFGKAGDYALLKKLLNV